MACSLKEEVESEAPGGSVLRYTVIADDVPAKRMRTQVKVHFLNRLRHPSFRIKGLLEFCEQSLLNWLFLTYALILCSEVWGLMEI